MRWLVLFAVGCGRIEFDPSAPRDASNDAAPVECWSAWSNGLPPLMAPTPITELDIPGVEHDMSLTSDGLQLYFTSDRAGSLGGDDIWIATRGSVTAPWETVEHVPSLSSDGYEGPAFTRDGLTVWISAPFVGGEGASDIWLGQRATRDQAFSLTQAGNAAINGVGDDYDVWVSSDGLRLYYSTDLKLSTSVRPTTSSPWGAPTELAGLNIAGEWDPTLSEDERVIVFASNRSGPERHIYFATRATTATSFGAPQALTTLNSSGWDFDPHIAPDGCAIYFASDRGRTTGDVTLYVSRVVP